MSDAEIIPLVPRRGARHVKEEFEHYLREGARNGWGPKCVDRPDLYADYLYSPSRDEAEELCEGCPLLELCDEYANLTRPAWGVWGGKARAYGQVAYERNRRRREDRKSGAA